MVDHLPNGLTENSLREVYRYAIRLVGGDRELAEELVQETCEAAWRASQTEPDDLGVGWMIVVLRRRFMDHLRRTYRHAAHESAEPVENVSVAEVEPAWSSVDGGEALSCLGQITPDQRAALIWRYVDDLPVDEVAALLGRSVAATESLLARGRRQLAKRVMEARHG